VIDVDEIDANCLVPDTHFARSGRLWLTGHDFELVYAANAHHSDHLIHCVSPLSEAHFRSLLID
jgi:hypothetical protein